jgi:hypothetical protein
MTFLTCDRKGPGSILGRSILSVPVNNLWHSKLYHTLLLLIISPFIIQSSSVIQHYICWWNLISKILTGSVAAGPRQHSHSCFRVLSGPTAIFLFFPRLCLFWNGPSSPCTGGDSRGPRPPHRLLVQDIIFQLPVAFEVTNLHTRPSLMQLCSFGLCDLDVQFTGSVKLCSLKSTNCNCRQFVKNGLMFSVEF